jgi:hypothetical protein
VGGGGQPRISRTGNGILPGVTRMVTGVVGGGGFGDSSATQSVADDLPLWWPPLHRPCSARIRLQTEIQPQVRIDRGQFRLAHLAVATTGCRSRRGQSPPGMAACRVVHGSGSAPLLAFAAVAPQAPRLFFRSVKVPPPWPARAQANCRSSMFGLLVVLRTGSQTGPPMAKAAPPELHHLLGRRLAGEAMAAV